MTFDWDDHHPGNDAMPWMRKLKAINPAFKATLFTVPGLCTEEWVLGHPDWVELVPHGWMHPTPMECAHWTADQMRRLMREPAVRLMEKGWKSPGWQISDATYQVLLEEGWWVADQHLEDSRRPAGLRAYFYEDGNWHGHVQNVCGNGIEETWPGLCEAVRDATDIRFASEAAH